MASELFQLLTDIDLIDVPYRGGAPALSDLLAGQVQVMFGGSSDLSRIHSSRPVSSPGVTTAARSDLLPDLPAVGEFVPGYEVSSWFGIGAPKNTPADIVGMLNTSINAGLAGPHLKSHLVDLSATVLPGSPADYGELIIDEIEKWRKLIQKAKIKLT